MSKVNINVNNKSFTIACDDGQESRVQQLGRYVDERFRELNQAGAAPNEAYTLVLTALVIADDMFEAKDAAEKALMAADRAAPKGPSAAEIEARLRAELAATYDRHIAGMQAEIGRLKAVADRAAQEAQAARGNVTDLAQVRAEAKAEADAAMKAREAEIARAVDSLTDKLETVVKKLKRA